VKCTFCGAILTVDGTKMGAVGNRTEVEAIAWAMDKDVTCWRCGHTVKKPTQKPSDRTKLKRGGIDGGMFGGKRLNAIEYYARQGQLREVYRKIRGRKVDEGL